MNLDEIDFQIIQLLIKDARIPAQEIANKTGKHLTTISRRLKILENEKIIKGYAAVVDYEALGLELTIITQLTMEKGKLFETEHEISKLPGVCAVYDVTGRIDSIVIAKFRNREEVSEFAKKLLAMPFVDRTETHVVLNIIKEDFQLFDKF
ncbi:MAG: Lrp/AsnC family transcriptional regulator [Candidatus Heimdallarchaeota archaeon]|nr:Lrp/AsnC family transcriptional regulator [Candidatus Heimdallarchaeota archaeon]